MAKISINYYLVQIEGPDRIPRDLRHTIMSYYDTEECNEIYGTITENKFCADNNLGHNPCQVK